MARQVYIPIQTVAGGANSIFNTAEACPYGYVIHENGSGLTTLRGITSKPCAEFVRYHCKYSGNMAISAGETVAPISLAIAKNGEALPNAIAIQTPAAVGDYNHLTIETDILVAVGCCVQLTIKNVSTGGTSVDLQNGELVITRNIN